MKRLQILLCSSNLACLGSEELLSTGRNERQNDGLLCSESGEKTLGLETAHQWQRSFFLEEIIKALVAERLNLPPSKVKGSISIGVAGTAWAPALENIPALTEEGWTCQPLQFGLVSIAQFWGQNFQAEVPGVRHQTSGAPTWSQGTSCSALVAS